MATATTSLTREAFDFEKQYWEATKARDFPKMEQMTRPEFTMVMEEGSFHFTPREFTDMLKKDNYKLVSYSIDEGDASATEIAKGVVALSYHSKQEYEMNGERGKADAYNCAILVKKGNTFERAVETLRGEDVSVNTLRFTPLRWSRRARARRFRCVPGLWAFTWGYLRGAGWPILPAEALCAPCCFASSSGLAS